MVYSYVLDILVSHTFRLKLINNFFGLLLSVRQGKMIISESHYVIPKTTNKFAQEPHYQITPTYPTTTDKSDKTTTVFAPEPYYPTTVLMWDPSSETWSEIGSLKFGRAYHASVAVDTSLFSFECLSSIKHKVNLDEENNL